MNDLEREVRMVLERDAERAPLVTEAPPHLRSRVRRRQIASAAIGVGVAVALTVAAVLGIGALTRADGGTPAEPEPPDAAPVVIERGSVQGWDWLLSASEDGTCVALTDRRGSTTLCPTDEEIAALGLPESNDLIGVAVRSVRPPGPEALFVFGIVSPRVSEVRVSDRAFMEASGFAFRRAPTPIESDRGFFVGRYDGYPYPVVPDDHIGVIAQGGDGSWFDAMRIRTPSWAKPMWEAVETIASGSWLAPGTVGNPQRWALGLWVNNMEGGALCYPEVEGPCGSSDDPLPEWRDAWRSLDWGDLALMEGRGSFGGGTGGRLLAGIFFDPIVDVRVEMRGGRVVRFETFPPPAAYPEAPSLFVAEWEGNMHEDRGWIIGLDASGDVVEREPV